ncbi:cation channel sperm-associated protein subunit beta-like isoform X2 [Acanthaster planci]|uniref:Cation channel sperm-associated protein subunit beta-like isoform X2 n=1 Tax=Acanthaster planci TaxID=133434 RepID=A0A8B7Y9I7_ACAPL|nr:cation channel sperm-associated protein subunit beta-like isoform X2 [Acanthaster planci]
MLPSSDSSFYLLLTTLGITLQLSLTSQSTGYFLSVGSYRTDAGELNGKFYLENSQVVFQCEIATDVDDRDDGLDTRSIGHSFASMGLAPHITIHNTTWIRTIHFPLESWNSSLGVWYLSKSKEDIFTQDSGTEDWIVEVDLDTSTELLRVATSLMDLTKVSFVNTNLGEPVASSSFMTDPSLLSDVTKFLLAPAPCSPDVAVLGLGYNSTETKGIIVGVTRDAVGRESNNTFWYNITTQLCQAVTPNECDEIALIDLILTADQSLLLLTTHGLFRGQLPSSQPRDSRGTLVQKQVLWNLVELPSSISFISFHLSYTPVCFNRYTKSSTEQVAYVAMVKSGNDKAVYASYSPYTNWTVSASNCPFSQPSSLVYDHHTNSFVILQEKEGVHSILAFSTDQLLQVGAVNCSRFSSFDLPSAFFPTEGRSLCFNPTTHEIFVYGNQVWLSNDGGDSFHQVLILYHNETINGCYISAQGGDVIFTSNLHKLFFGKTGVKRLIELVISPSPSTLQSLAVHITQTGSIIVMGITKLSQQWWVQEIKISRAVQLSEIVPQSALAVQFVTEAKAILYEVISAEADNRSHVPRMLSPMTAGKQLNQRDIGRAIITDSLPEFQIHNYSVVVGRAHVYKQFDAETWMTRPALKHDVIIQPYDGKTVLMYLKVKRSVPGWHCGDVGKTFEMPGASSILILACHNRTHIQGLPLIVQMLKDTYPAKRWRLFDLRAYPNQAEVINQTLSVNTSSSIACLEEEGRFAFTQLHTNMTLEVTGGHAKIGQIIDESCCQLVDISDSVSGQFSPREWGLYQTFPDGRGGMFPHLTLTEASCQHHLTPDTNASKYAVRQLDLSRSFKFSLTASRRGKKAKDRPLMYYQVANAKLINVRSSYAQDKYGSETMTLSVRNMLHRKGSSSVTFNLPDASLLCPRTSFTLTFQAACPFTKHLHYVYQPQLTQQEFLYGNPTDSKGKPILIDIPVNYRPPSLLGISIPTSNNIYNADPSQPRPRDIYQISKDSGTYKQCLGKTNRSECGCTDAMKMSSLERDTDCRQRAYRLVHPGKLSLRFQILEAETEPTELLELYVITLKEVNGRQDYMVEAESTPSLDKMKEELSEVMNNTSEFIDPATVRLTLTGSGLYHFRASVIPGFSYCNLEDEVQVYVDMAPLPNPTQMIVITVISIVIGGVLFSVYLYYLHLHHQPRIRKTGSQCMDPQELREQMKQ